MNLLVLHLSDIHFKKDSDPILKRTPAIVAAVRPYLPNVGTIAIVLSGDVAQAGLASEYKLARRFILDLSARIKGETKVTQHIIIAPGNHDCDFRGDQAARNLVVAEILKQSAPVPDSFLIETTRVQKEFFAFRRDLEPKSISHQDKLWTVYDITLDGFKVTFDVLNASWMSTRHEQQGGLKFPFETYADLNGAADLRLCILHHPLNWYNQSNYRNFRSFLHRRADFVLTGHEHVGAARETEDASDGNCIYIEGEALQTSNASHSGFNLLIVDTLSRQYKYETLRLEGSRYEPQKSSTWDAFRPIAKKDAGTFGFSKHFLSVLQDAGATLKHFSGREILLDDIFIYPDIDERLEKPNDSDRVRGARLNAAYLSKPENLTKDVLIQGDDEGGKTRLLYKLATDYIEKGYAPLFLRADKLRSAAPASVASDVESAARMQYGESNFKQYRQIAKAKRILLLDDFDKSPLNADRKSALFLELRERFGRILLTVGENFEMRELFKDSDLADLSGMRHYKILPLGNSRRLELTASGIVLARVNQPPKMYF